MMTKAPKAAVQEAIRVLRYLQGTKHYGLSFKSCPNPGEVIEYTDANHAPTRSQTGIVIKLGMSVVTWRSMKQSVTSLSSAESEVQALAMTGVLADFVSTLRESLCLPTQSMEIRCDNTAAIVLATGEGSWKTKAAANKVAAIRERVEQGEIKVSYVGTKDQCADSLTKFLRGGPDQYKARGHLSLISLEECISRRGTRAKACGLHTTFRVFRVFCPPTGAFSSELSGPESFGPFSLERRKKRLCQLKDVENFVDSVAISVANKKASYLCGPLYRDLTRTEYKCSIMVRAFVPTEPKEEDVEMQPADADELPDFTAADDQSPPPPLTDGDIRAKFTFPSWEDEAENLKVLIKKTGIHPVDPISICCKATPIPIKDLDPTRWL